LLLSANLGYTNGIIIIIIIMWTDATTCSYRSVFCEIPPALDAAVNFCRAVLCKSVAYAVMRCPSVRPSVHHVRGLCRNE